MQRQLKKRIQMNFLLIPFRVQGIAASGSQSTAAALAVRFKRSA